MSINAFATIAKTETIPVVMSDPDYPNVMLSFFYRGFMIQITRDRWEKQDIYTAWANYNHGSAVAVPCAVTSKLAIRNAKRWVDRRIIT